MKRLLLLTFMFLLQFNLYAQQSPLQSFTINGSINADTGKVQLNILFDNGYYPDEVHQMIAEVKNNKFTFNGFIKYPQCFTISYGKNYYSNIFVISAGIQSMACNIDSYRETPRVDNPEMKEYYNEYLPAYNKIDQKRSLFRKKTDSLDKVFNKKLPDELQLKLEKELKGYYAESDSILLKYVSHHPTSYTAFWHFINLFSSFGYENLFDSIYSKFSDSIRETYAGKVLKSKLEIATAVSIGKQFPSIKSVNVKNKPLNQSSFLNNNYTLVDFWYSHCGPCIAQFPELKKIYEKYKSKGFEIVGISTDKIKYKKDWQNMIAKEQLPWLQYWDINGIESAKLSINAFPTNFLLDMQGKIVQKNLRPIELEQFLDENIKNN